MCECRNSNKQQWLQREMTLTQRQTEDSVMGQLVQSEELRSLPTAAADDADRFSLIFSVADVDVDEQTADRNPQSKWTRLTDVWNPMYAQGPKGPFTLRPPPEGVRKEQKLSSAMLSELKKLAVEADEKSAILEGNTAASTGFHAAVEEPLQSAQQQPVSKLWARFVDHYHMDAATREAREDVNKLAQVLTDAPKNILGKKAEAPRKDLKEAQKRFTAMQTFALGETVQMRDSNGVFLQGIVTTSGAGTKLPYTETAVLKVKSTSSKPRSWDEVRKIETETSVPPPGF